MSRELGYLRRGGGIPYNHHPCIPLFGVLTNQAHVASRSPSTSPHHLYLSSTVIAPGCRAPPLLLFLYLLLGHARLLLKRRKVQGLQRE